MHTCPGCGSACYCGGDIDDIECEPDASRNCTHCDGTEPDDDFTELPAIALTTTSPAELRRLFFDPPEPPILPAKRQPYHNGRRWKLEPQGRADRRVRRQYREAMNWHYWTHSDEAKDFALSQHRIDITSLTTPPTSLYDWVMKNAKP